MDRLFRPFGLCHLCTDIDQRTDVGILQKIVFFLFLIVFRVIIIRFIIIFIQPVSAAIGGHGGVQIVYLLKRFLLPSLFLGKFFFSAELFFLFPLQACFLRGFAFRLLALRLFRGFAFRLLALRLFRGFAFRLLALCLFRSFAFRLLALCLFRSFAFRLFALRLFRGFAFRLLRCDSLFFFACLFYCRALFLKDFRGGRRSKRPQLLTERTGEIPSRIIVLCIHRITACVLAVCRRFGSFVLAPGFCFCFFFCLFGIFFPGCLTVSFRRGFRFGHFLRLRIRFRV